MLNSRYRRMSITMTLMLLLCCSESIAAQPAASDGTDTVYVTTNRAKGNTVQVYRRVSNGLTLAQEISTRGLGTGLTLDPLQSQGSLALRDDGKILIAVNAASGEITAFVVTATGLKIGSKVLSGGALPVSVTIHGGLVYVLNQLGAPNIVGFRVDANGNLQRLNNSSRLLAGGALAQPAEVSFTPDGAQLLVTEKGTDQIDVFKVEKDGTTTGPSAVPSAGKTPFGFTFGSSATVVVTEAERRLPMKATASSYELGSEGLKLASGAVPDRQTAACWVAVTGQTAWVVNTGTAAISSYQISGNGKLALINPVAATTGANSSPIDVAASRDGKTLYVLESAVGAIAAFQVNGNTLTPLFVKTGLPLSIQGIVVR